MSTIFKFSISIIVPLAAGGIGSYFTSSEIQGWYQNLDKPFFNPPNYLFAPVWTILYILMGIGFFLVWQNQEVKKRKEKVRAIEYFFGQLFLNIFWSIAFFGLHSPLLGFIVLIVLWYLIFKTIKSFAKVNKTASYLLYPYIAWVSFAGILNFSIFLLNR